VEREGVNGFAGQKFFRFHTVRLDYFFDRYRPLRNASNWSLFGGPKRFRANFSRVPDTLAARYAGDFNAEVGSAIFTYAFDTRDDEDDPTRGWLGRLEIEHGGPDLGGDLFYTRWRATLQRYQPVTLDQNLSLRAIYGNSGERLPLQRLFFLGGLGTLRGYEFKEFAGDQFALLNADYGVRLPKGSLTAVLFFDLGTATFRRNLSDAGPWKADVGLGLKLGSIVRFDLAKRLDDFDRNLKLTVRFARMF
jgi:outer membrane protein assembly factor BamA